MIKLKELRGSTEDEHRLERKTVCGYEGCNFFCWHCYAAFTLSFCIFTSDRFTQTNIALENLREAEDEVYRRCWQSIRSNLGYD